MLSTGTRSQDLPQRVPTSHVLIVSILPVAINGPLIRTADGLARPREQATVRSECWAEVLGLAYAVSLSTSVNFGEIDWLAGYDVNVLVLQPFGHFRPNPRVPAKS